MNKSDEFWVMQHKGGGIVLPIDGYGAEALFYHAFPTANRKQYKAVPVRVTKVVRRRPAKRGGKRP